MPFLAKDSLVCCFTARKRKRSRNEINHAIALRYPTEATEKLFTESEATWARNKLRVIATKYQKKATVEKSITLILCRFEGLGKKLKEIK